MFHYQSILCRSLMLGLWLVVLISPSHTRGQEFVDDRKPFALELPELNTGLIFGVNALEANIPVGQTVTRVRFWVIEPYAARVNYSVLRASLNGQAVNNFAPAFRGTAGKYRELDLRRMPLKPGKNNVEITARDSESGSVYRCGFVILNGVSATQAPVLAVAESVAISTSEVLVPDDPHAPHTDHIAPKIALATPDKPLQFPSEVAEVTIAGKAHDPNGQVVSVTANGQLIASPPVLDKKNKKEKKDKKNKNTEAMPVLVDLSFNTIIKVEAAARSVLIEAKDVIGNRTMVTVPIQRTSVLASLKPKFGGRVYALIIGVSDYQFREAGLNDLQFAHRDAEAIRDFLKTPAGGNLTDNEVRCLTEKDATLPAVQRALAGFLDAAGPNDLIYLFLAGHGSPDPYKQQDLYFLLHDTKVLDLEHTALSMRSVGDFVQQRGKAGTRLIAFFDTCHSAGIQAVDAKPRAAQPALPKPAPLPVVAKSRQQKNGDRGVGTGASANKPPANPPVVAAPPSAQPATRLSANLYDAELFRQRGWTVITSANRDELAQEGSQWKLDNDGGHGVFTWALLKGLQGEADKNRDCKVTAKELSDYVSETVSIATGRVQNPQTLSGGNGEMALATLRCAGGSKS